MTTELLKITVSENKNIDLTYPHLKQSIDYPGLIMLFNNETTATVIAIGKNTQFKLGIKYDALIPGSFKIFKGIIKLTQ